MNAPPENRPARDRETGHCLARSVADTLAEEPALEAVTIDRAHQKISVATLGRADVARLTERITSQLQAAQSADTGHVCSLLTGEGDCFTCDTPLPESERNRITIRHRGRHHHHRAHDVPDRAEILALARHAVSQGRPARRGVHGARRGD